MFVITLNRKKINQAVAVFICVVTATAVGLGVKNYFTKDSAASASAKTKLSTTQEMVDYIASKGFT
ncbi:MAG: hypothetical protein IIV99_06335, partial [Oscillospiraceae bacterium]|nr:hypothetical protein [Oscillospiraceae bacterium]